MSLGELSLPLRFLFLYALFYFFFVIHEPYPLFSLFLSFLSLLVPGASQDFVFCGHRWIIVNECTGTVGLSASLALSLASPFSPRKKFLFFLTSAPLLYLFNLLRTAFLIRSSCFLPPSLLHPLLFFLTPILLLYLYYRFSPLR